jgi:hypothetical protein
LIFGSGLGAVQTSGWILSIIGAIIGLVIYSSLVSKRGVCAVVTAGRSRMWR